MTTEPNRNGFFAEMQIISYIFIILKHIQINLQFRKLLMLNVRFFFFVGGTIGRRRLLAKQIKEEKSWATFLFLISKLKGFEFWNFHRYSEADPESVKRGGRESKFLDAAPENNKNRPKKQKSAEKKGGPRPIRPPPPWIRHWYCSTVKGCMQKKFHGDLERLQVCHTTLNLVTH